jgi:uncharacterized phage protein (TIGR01671 family)
MNNRKLKFRAWDKLNKSFIYSHTGHQMHYILTLDGRFQNLQNGSGGDEYVVQQYTGLKDKNGKDIYEGDFIKATSDQYENENFVGKVIFDEGSYLTWINKNDIRGINEDDFEVIGNIFDNPGLLKL